MAALSLALAALIVAAAALTVRLGKGTVVVEGPDAGQLPDDITVVLKSGGTQLEISSANDWKIAVTPGAYQVQVQGGEDLFEVKNGEITVSRFGKQIVRVVRQEPLATAPAGGAKPKPEADVAGQWRIQEAENFAGETYGGMVTIRAKDSGVVNLSWQDGGKVVQTGVGFLQDGHLLAAWGVAEPFGVCLYKILPDGKLEARWTTTQTSDRVASETARGGTPGKLEGQYQVEGTSVEGGQPYTGSLVIARFGDTYDVDWLTGGMRYHGIGLRHGDYLLVAWSVPEAAGYGAVDYKLHGDTAEGRWTMIGQPQLSFEVLQRVRE